MKRLRVVAISLALAAATLRLVTMEDSRICITVRPLLFGSVSFEDLA
jgi:hypothetical protein